MRKHYKLTRFDNVEPADFGAAATMAEHKLAQQMAADTEEFVPALTGTFSRNSRVIRNMIIYQGDQVFYLWKGHKMVNAKTGKGPRLIPDVGYRWPLHAKLRETNKPLTYTKNMHPKAQDHWMEASEKQNGSAWEKFAEEAIARELNK